MDNNDSSDDKDRYLSVFFPFSDKIYLLTGTSVSNII